MPPRPSLIRASLAACPVPGLGLALGPVLAIALGFGLSTTACSLPPPLDGRSAYAANAEPLDSAWLRSASEVPAKDFMAIEGVGKLPPRVRGDSAYWSERFLSPSARPLDRTPPALLLSVHARGNTSPDLLRYQYRVDRLELTIIESASFTLVRVGGTGVGAEPETGRAALIARVASAVLNVKGAGHDWHFAPLERLGGDARFSTNPDADPAKMSSWEERADAGVAKDLLYFFLYKKNPERFGYDNAQSWFDDEFRKIFRTW